MQKDLFCLKYNLVLISNKYVSQGHGIYLDTPYENTLSMSARYDVSHFRHTFILLGGLSLIL